LTFLALDGTVNEVDLIVIGPAGLYLVELKIWGGRIRGSGQSWRTDHPRRAHPNPLFLANAKAQRFKYLLTHQARRSSDHGRIPHVQPVIFLHNPNVVSMLDEVGRRWVYGREDAPESCLPRIVSDLLGRDADDPDKVVSIEESDRLAALLERLDFTQSIAQLTFGSVVLDELTPHAEGPQWQEYLAHNVSSPSLRRRVRMFRASMGASEEERRTVWRAAERAVHLMQGVSHPGIAKPLELLDHDSGPVVVYEHEVDQQRFDLYLADQHGRLTIDQQLGLIRQLAETLQYAHTRHLYHRALRPSSIYVRHPGSDPQLVITDWHTGARDQSSIGSLASLLAGTSHLDQLVDVADRCYLAPELATRPDTTGPAVDVFCLGALAYAIVSGRPPATTPVEFRMLLGRGGGLDLGRAVEVVDERLRMLVYRATSGAVSQRLSDVKRFLAELDLIEQAAVGGSLGRFVDPLDARRGDVLDGLFRVERRLGKGSTAVGLLVTRMDRPDDQPVVLKVALDHGKDHRLDAEGKVLEELDDRRIIKLVEGPLRVGDRRTLVLEYGGDETLAQRLRSGPLSIRKVQLFGRDLFEIATRLDSLGIWHRDIKPANLGIRLQDSDQQSHLVLYDFSMSSVSASDIDAGTPPYLDPFLGGDRPVYDDAAERFAVAVTLYEMTTGTLPTWAESISRPSFVNAEVTVEAQLIDILVREKLADFFRQALVKDVDRRYQTLKAMADAWFDAFDGIEATQQQDLGRRSTSRRLLTHRRLNQRVKLSLAALTVTAMVGLGAAGSQQFVTAPGGTKTTDSTADKQSHSSAPADPPAPGNFYLQANFAIEPIPPGFELTDGIVTRAAGQLMTLHNTAGQQTLVAVYQAGAFDTRQVENPKPVKIGNYSGFYDDKLPDVLTGNSSAYDQNMPAVILQYAPGSWYVVQTETQGQAGRDAVMQIADKVRIGTYQPLRFPIQLRYLPVGLHPCYSLYHSEATNQDWEGQIGLCDDQPGDTDPPYNGSALEIELHSTAQIPPPGPGRTVAGYPVQSNGLGLFVGCGDFTMWIGPSPNHKYRYGLVELERIVEGLVVRPLGNEKQWFEGGAVVTVT
jgi:serine/threonine protein kinase